MNGYAETQRIIINQIQTERRAEAAGNRQGAEWRRGEAACRRVAERNARLQKLTTVVGLLAAIWAR